MHQQPPYSLVSSSSFLYRDDTLGFSKVAENVEILNINIMGVLDEGNIPIRVKQTNSFFHKQPIKLFQGIVRFLKFRGHRCTPHVCADPKQDRTLEAQVDAFDILCWMRLLTCKYFQNESTREIKASSPDVSIMCWNNCGGWCSFSFNMEKLSSGKGRRSTAFHAFKGPL